MKIGGFEACTVTDFPNKVASIIFTVGCNFRCPYCYNKDLLSEQNFSESNRKEIPKQNILDYLDKYKDMIDGVVLTGGEPLIHTNIVDLITTIKWRGFSVKLDTNGSNPELLNVLLLNDYIDYVAMDIKAPPHLYPEFVGYSNYENIKKSIELLKTTKVPHEFRITLYSALTKEMVVQMIKMVPGETVYIQKFNPTHAQDAYARTLIPMPKEDIDYIINETKDIAKVAVR